MEWLTEYLVNGEPYGGNVYGNSLIEAQLNADVLGLGKVIGNFIFSTYSMEDARLFWGLLGGDGFNI